MGEKKIENTTSSLFLCKSNISLPCLPQPRDSRADGDRSRVRDLVRTSSDSLITASALPNPHALALHRVLSAKVASVFGVLRDLNLTEQFPQRGTISRAVLSGDTDLLRAAGHHLADDLIRKLMVPDDDECVSSF